MRKVENFIGLDNIDGLLHSGQVGIVKECRAYDCNYPVLSTVFRRTGVQYYTGYIIPVEEGVEYPCDIILRKDIQKVEVICPTLIPQGENLLIPIEETCFAEKHCRCGKANIRERLL
jgi:hypothetical protein